MVTFAADDPLSAEFRAAIDDAIAGFLAVQRRRLAAIGSEVGALAQLAEVFTLGGKRMRPGFCYWGHVAAGGQAAEASGVLTAAASLDVLHVSALVHDDVMDSSDTRRGVPAAHRQFEEQHRDVGGQGDPAGFGRGAAILLGDLLLCWSVEMLARSGVPADRLAAAMPLVEAMRTEVTCGQYLDILAQSGRLQADPVAQANRVVEFKTARYTVQRPVQFGAALAGADKATLDGLAAYASPLGRAFQFRDDLLGVFGSAEVTGKPAGDDLREGKRTVLVAHAFQLGSPAAAERLQGLLGRADLTAADIDVARDIISGSGALAATEAAIERGHAAALDALERAPLTREGRLALTRLAELAVRRDF